MDERIKAGLKAGIASLLGIWTGYLVFLLAGFLAVDFGEKTIQDTRDVALTSLVAASPCMIIHFLICIYLGEYVEGVVIMPTAAVVLSLGAALFRAKLKLGTSIRLKEILELPIAHRGVCPVCGRRVESTWQFCPYCRSSLELIICPHCRYANPSTTARCQNCGSSLSEGTKVY